MWFEEPSHQYCGCPSGTWVYIYFQCMQNGCGQQNVSDDRGCSHTQPPATQLEKKLEKFTVDDKPTVRVYCKSLTKYSLTIRNDKLMLAPLDPSDPHQHWIKDEKFGKTIKDEEGYSSFALVKKAIGVAIKHSVGVTYPAQLTKYDPDKLDESVLWTQGKRLDDGYKAIRGCYNIQLNLDAYDCQKELGKTNIRLYEWNGGNNQRWSIVLYCKFPT